MSDADFFQNYFTAFTEHTPLRWQTRLYERLLCGDVPPTCNLLTGLGKTSVIPIWLIALTMQCGADEHNRLPRRLVYVVNRRTVVDQATDVVAQMRQRLQQPGDARWKTYRDALIDLAKRLRAMAAFANDEPFGVSTLRGELADNEEWKTDPARPAIIIGTIDMIGSKLLFSGYGDMRYGRAHHAGLIGQDALIVHDESHLSPAFDSLLDAVMKEQKRTKEARPIRVMKLSATTRRAGNGTDSNANSFGIENDDRHDPVVQQRLSACKRLEIVKVENDKAVSTIAAKALELGIRDARVLVYVRSPESAQKVRDEIIKGLKNRAKNGGTKLADDDGVKRVGLLTGTIRGHERDGLANSELFKALQSNVDRVAARDASAAKALFLVSTSAGEVGADWDADHLVCDLTPLDSMIQRVGRVNRLGGNGREARIALVVGSIGEKDPLKKPIQQTLKALKQLPAVNGEFDASPKAVSDLLASDGVQNAFSPVPTILHASDILFDHWSLTSIGAEMPGRPAVEEYLHGVADWEPPETHVAWREDIAILAQAGSARDGGERTPCSRDELEEVFGAFPLRSTETLRDRTDRVQDQLQAIAERLGKMATSVQESKPAGGEPKPENESETAPDDQDESRPVPTAKLSADPWVVLMRGTIVRWVQLSELADKDKQKKEQAQRLLAFATVVLPVESGGLKDGMLVGNEPAPNDPQSLDVAEVAHNGASDRQRVKVVNGAAHPLLGGEALDGIARVKIALTAADDDETEPTILEYRVAKGQEREPGKCVRLREHNDAVSATGERIGTALGLEDRLVDALRLAGTWHDAGKARAVWQRYANNSNGAEPIAKSDKYGHWKMLGGYRHEFGSLLDAATDSEITNHAERDLILHLIAAHHGWGRPHFEPRHFDRGEPGILCPTAKCEAAAVEAIQRFGHLQQRYGRWGVAWLESLLRCADAEASKSVAPDNSAMLSVKGGER
ncbi:MAG TPA: type I-U CRISPR-associated helicase/endonuclease Cas3 [Phycisphaerales bacterium]|nr:type I-U CRISPR-associated helicase/endonuclease Cas3 [Phycisphaerales bacterium]